jgi:PhoH-like ATPase
MSARKSIQARRVFVLDTNVLMHDPTAIFRFDEHDIFLPMVVLEELDLGKKGVSETARTRLGNSPAWLRSAESPPR